MYSEKQNRKIYNGNRKDKSKCLLKISKNNNSTTTGCLMLTDGIYNLWPTISTIIFTTQSSFVYNY